MHESLFLIFHTNGDACGEDVQPELQLQRNKGSPGDTSTTVVVLAGVEVAVVLVMLLSKATYITFLTHGFFHILPGEPVSNHRPYGPRRTLSTPAPRPPHRCGTSTSVAAAGVTDVFRAEEVDSGPDLFSIYLE